MLCRPLGSSDGVERKEELSILQVNDICVTLWLEGSTKQWYIGYCKEANDNGTFEVEHIHRIKSKPNLIRKSPICSDWCDVRHEQVLKCDVVGEWDFQTTELWHLLWRIMKSLTACLQTYNVWLTLNLVLLCFNCLCFIGFLLLYISINFIRMSKLSNKVAWKFLTVIIKRNTFFQC